MREGVNVGAILPPPPPPPSAPGYKTTCRAQASVLALEFKIETMFFSNKIF